MVVKRPRRSQGICSLSFYCASVLAARELSGDESVIFLSPLNPLKRSRVYISKWLVVVVVGNKLFPSIIKQRRRVVYIPPSTLVTLTHSSLYNNKDQPHQIDVLNQE